MGLINQILSTGRALLAVEAKLDGMTPRHPDWRRLGAEHARLRRQQEDEIVAAYRSGIPHDTVRFALAMHGQGADREAFLAQPPPTPAAQLQAMIREHGAPAVVEALADLRSCTALSRTTTTNPGTAPADR